MKSKILEQKRSWTFIAKIIAIAIMSGACFLVCVYMMSVFALCISSLLEKGQGVWVPAVIVLLLSGSVGLYYLRKRILRGKDTGGLSGEGD